MAIVQGTVGIGYKREVSVPPSTASVKTALVTGASSGIGLELTRLLAADHYRLVLVARNRAALQQIGEELQARHGIEVRISPKDLAHPSSPAELYRELQEVGIAVDVLVNNAGFGGSGPFLQTDWHHEVEMIQVNIVALTHLTKLFLPQIHARQGKVLQRRQRGGFSSGPIHGDLLRQQGIRAALSAKLWRKS